MWYYAEGRAYHCIFYHQNLLVQSLLPLVFWMIHCPSKEYYIFIQGISISISISTSISMDLYFHELNRYNPSWLHAKSSVDNPPTQPVQCLTVHIPPSKEDRTTGLAWPLTPPSGWFAGRSAQMWGRGGGDSWKWVLAWPRILSCVWWGGWNDSVRSCSCLVYLSQFGTGWRLGWNGYMIDL